MTLADLDINADGLIASESEKADIIQCIRTLILTPEGTVPLYREFGLNTEFIGAPQGVAENLLAVEIMDKVDKYESRVTVREVSCTATATGQLIAKVAIASA